MNVYNILKNETSKNLFYFGVLLFIVIFISNKYTITINLFIILILYYTIINIFYTYNQENKINKNKELEIKNKEFPEIKSESIKDLLFYLKTLKEFSKLNYEKLIILFINFDILYNNCITDNNLINSNYSILYDLKLNIINLLNSYKLNGYILDNLDDIVVSTNNILNKYLSNLNNINDKYLYYNGYNIDTKKLNNTKVSAYNLLNYQNENINGIELVNINNLLSL